MKKKEIFNDSINKKIKDEDLKSFMFNCFEDKVKEIAILTIAHCEGNEVFKKNEKLVKYTFLLQKDNYVEYSYNNIDKKIKEISSIEVFKEVFEETIKELEIDEDEKLKSAKEKIFSIYDKEHEYISKKKYYLEMKKGKVFSKTMEVGTLLFAALCAALIYNTGLTEYSISLAVLLGLTFTFVSSAGEYFEKLRFRHKMQKVLPSKFIKGLNAMSFCYFLIFLTITVILFSFSFIGIVKTSREILGLQNDVIRNGFILITFSIAAYWHFRSAVYQKRYSMFEKFESINTREDVSQFLTHINKDWLKNKIQFRKNKSTQ